jgi:hypothetical protein
MLTPERKAELRRMWEDLPWHKDCKYGYQYKMVKDRQVTQNLDGSFSYDNKCVSPCVFLDWMAM